MITRYEDFKVEAAIPALEPVVDPLSPNSAVVQEVVSSYINKYEPMFAAKFFKSSADYQTMVELSEKQHPTEEEAEKLALLRFSLSHYIAFYYFRSQKNTPIGSVVLESENGTRTSLEDTLILLWNQMVENNEVLWSMIYDEKYCKCNELFVKVNMFGL